MLRDSPGSAPSLAPSRHDDTNALDRDVPRSQDRKTARSSRVEVGRETQEADGTWDASVERLSTLNLPAAHTRAPRTLLMRFIRALLSAARRAYGEAQLAFERRDSRLRRIT